MARNIEVKARIDCIESVIALAKAIASSGPTEIIQDDTFFMCPNGRLKLRIFSEHDGQLIFYQRADSAAPKESNYVISPTGYPCTLLQTLEQALGVSGRVRKHRTLFWAGRTRIHLDRVEGLGSFIELEVVLDDGESNDIGVSVALDLLAKLAISPQQLVVGAYVDLIAASPANRSGLCNENTCG